jgi:hypothetical protein
LFSVAIVRCRYLDNLQELENHDFEQPAGDPGK